MPWTCGLLSVPTLITEGRGPGLDREDAPTRGRVQMRPLLAGENGQAPGQEAVDHGAHGHDGQQADDTVDPAATALIQSFSARLNKLPTRFDGFSPQSSINSISETLIKQLLSNGCCMGELVLDKTLAPSHIQPISTNKNDG